MLAGLLGMALMQHPPASGLALLKEEAKVVRGQVKSELAKSFLDAVSGLKPVERRVLWWNAQTQIAFTDEEYQRLTKGGKDGFVKREYDERFYYTTAFGSPMIYALPLELAARYGMQDFKGKKVVDFGYGMIGQLQMMAHAGAQVHGVDVQPIFAKLYSWPGDTGAIGKGSVRIHNGQWPLNEDLKKSAGGNIDLFLAKNVLKLGYIHPKREANPNQLIDLGVSDQKFLQELFKAMKPGGLVVIYNLSPAPAKASAPYIPWADGEYPFDWALTRLAGFEILLKGEKDDAAARKLFLSLGYDNGSGMEGLEADLFSNVTVLRRPK